MIKLTDNEIRIRIVPTHLRWPEASTSIVWRRLHECVQQLHEFARAVDNDYIGLEQQRELGRDEIERRRHEVGHEALKKLTDFRPFEVARTGRDERNRDVAETRGPDAPTGSS